MDINTRIIVSNEFNPWWNLAVEEYLLDSTKLNECILYLWQNQNTVVIGKNQNAWKECRVDQLEAEGGYLARRLSGGGAVFHDTGNLNFTFLADRNIYDVKRQTGVLLAAVKKLGISAEMSGRNDLTADGKKFSGNAYCVRKNSAYHHGTLLVNADFEKLSRYLQISKEKIQSKGIESVRSRVVNLTEFNPDLTIKSMSEALIEAFMEEYGKCRLPMENTHDIDRLILQPLYDKYSSWEWKYGESPKFDIVLNEYFGWGSVELGLKLEKGVVKEANVYSDAMDEEFIGLLPYTLKGKYFKSVQLADAVRNMDIDDEKKPLAENIASWLERMGF